MTEHKKGILICIEGIDGAGKTTHVLMLRDWLVDHNLSVTRLKEPTQGIYGKTISELAAKNELSDPNQELKLFMEDRKEDVELNIRPALKSNDVVIMDRYYYSNMAYQGARGLDYLKIKEENERFAPVPDVLIILDIKPEIGMERVNKRKNKVDHFENVEYLTNVRKIFLEIGKEPNAVVIDTDQSIEAVHIHIIEAISKKLPEAIIQSK
jgi:dTMP kinase